MKTFGVMLALLVLATVSCDRKPQIRVSLREITNGDRLQIAWDLAGTTTSAGALLHDSVGPYFWLLVGKKLPLGEIQVTAIKMVGGERKSAIISPSTVSHDDPRTNLFGFAIRRLCATEAWSYKDPVEPGEYFIYLSQNNQEIIGETITVIE